MVMKSRFKRVIWVLLAAMIFHPDCGFGGELEMQFIETKVVDGFSIGITDEFGTTNSLSTRRLCFSIWGPTNEHARATFPTHPEYAYQVELIGSNGIAVPKTAAGKKAGSKFFDFGPNAGEQGIKIQRTFVGRKDAPFEMLVIFRPDELFKIEEPGNYVLRLRFQILAPRTGKTATNGVRQLIRFPVVEYPIVVR
jgi:hypothetical protein